MFDAFTPAEIDRIIEMAWEDRTPFEAIYFQFGLNESGVEKMMRAHLSEKSFKMWRKRIHAGHLKHKALRGKEISRFKCSRQKQITGNKISKR
jgi:uncharacterized protein (TIGR03643 family)